MSFTYWIEFRNPASQTSAEEVKYNWAIPLLERAFSIRKKKLAETQNYQDTVDTRNGLEHARKQVREQETTVLVVNSVVR